MQPLTVQVDDKECAQCGLIVRIEWGQSAVILGCPRTPALQGWIEVE